MIRTSSLIICTLMNMLKTGRKWLRISVNVLVNNNFKVVIECLK